MSDEEIILDTREQVEIQQLVSELKIPHKREVLKVGDFSIKNPVTGEYLCFIERKTVADLAQSIADQRLFDQMSRLEQVEVPCFLLISGSLTELQLQLQQRGVHVNENVIDGTLAAMGTQYGVHVYWLPNDRRLVGVAYRICLQMLQGSYMTPKTKHKREAKPAEALNRIVSFELSHRLLAEFLTLRSVANARVEDLMKVKGIGKLTAERIYKWFNE